jgi:hypothetical protein
MKISNDKYAKGEQIHTCKPKNWDAWTKIHEKLEFYDIKGFKVGLLIQFTHEFPMMVFKQLVFINEDEGWWHLPSDMPGLPLLFSPKAFKLA